VAIAVVILVISLKEPALEVKEVAQKPCVLNDPKNLADIFPKTIHLKDLKVKKKDS
jgi:hypothetical protein